MEDFHIYISYLRSIDIDGSFDSKGQHLDTSTKAAIFGSSSLTYICFCKLIQKKISRKLQNKDQKQVQRITNYILSSCHAFLAILIWLHLTFVSCKIPKKTFLTDPQCLDYTSGGMEIGMMISLSYFICDFISVKMIFVKGRMVMETFFHHLIAVIGILSALAIGRCIGPIMISLLITEISTIFLNNRSIMKELSYDE